jgi:hypothetical protein
VTEISKLWMKVNVDRCTQMLIPTTTHDLTQTQIARLANPTSKTVQEIGGGGQQAFYHPRK